MIPSALLTELVLVLIFSLIGGLLSRYTRFTPSVGYILSGVIGVSVAKQFNPHLFQSISLFILVVSLYLFFIGCSIQNWVLTKGSVKSYLNGLTQMVLVILILFPLFMTFSFNVQTALLLAFIFSLPSIILVSNEIEKRGLYTFPERQLYLFVLAQLFLLVPIFYVIPVVILSSDLSISLIRFAIPIAKFLGIIIGVMLSIKIFVYLYSKLHRYPSQEYRILVNSLLVVVTLLLIQASGFTLPIAAFFAGIFLSRMNENTEGVFSFKYLSIISHVLFLTLVGVNLNSVFFQQNIVFILLCTIVVIFVKYFAVYFALRNTGYFNRQASIIASNIAHIGEFSIIIGTLNIFVNGLTNYTANLVYAVGFTSIFISPLGALIFPHYTKILGENKFIKSLFGGQQEVQENIVKYDLDNHVVIFGYGRVGDEVRKILEYSNITSVVVDAHRKTSNILQSHSQHTIIGDPTDMHIMKSACIEKAIAAVITVDDFISQRKIIKYALSLNPRIKIICRTIDEKAKFDLANLGVNSIVIPELEAGMRIGREVLTLFNIPEKHIEEFGKRLRREHFLK